MGLLRAEKEIPVKMVHFQSREARCEELWPVATRVCVFDGSAAKSRWVWILALLGIVLGMTSLALGQTTWEFDKCLNDCVRLCNMQPERLRWGCQENCGGQCADKNKNTSRTNKPNPPAQPRAISWGAIAYSASDMKAGWSQGKSDRGSAEKEAMNTCSQRGKACVLRIAFNKQCGALAADRSFVGWATSTEARAAQQKAVEECTKNGGMKCALHVFFCSF
jgi:hypothetical protein